MSQVAVDAQSGFGIIVLDGKEAIVQLLRAREVVRKVRVGGGPQSKAVTVRAVGMLEGGCKGDPNDIKGKEAKMVVVAQGGRAPTGLLIVETPDRVEIWILDMFKDEPIVKKHQIEKKLIKTEASTFKLFPISSHSFFVLSTSKVLLLTLSEDLLKLTI